MIEHRSGDLFKSKAQAFVNPVNTQGIMGGGLALAFKRRYPAMFKSYADACKKGQLVVGKMHVYRHTGDPDFIINFPTKQEVYFDSKLEYIEEGLKDFLAQVQQFQIESVAIPALGCGLGGLDWEIVKPIIIDSLKALPDIHFMVYDP